MMNITYDNELCTPPEIRNIAESAKNELLPEKSKLRYTQAYEYFLKWKADNRISQDLVTENILLAYFRHLSTERKPSTLWSLYSMLHKTIELKQHIDISKYTSLRAFLKKQSKGYKPVQAKTFTEYELKQFLDEAPNEMYLAMKVSLRV
jgi:hypothetical protein